MCEGEAYSIEKMGTEEQARAITVEALYRRYRDLLETAPVYLYYCGSAHPTGWKRRSGLLLRLCPRASGRRSPSLWLWPSPRVRSVGSLMPWT